MRAKPYITSGTCHVTLVRSDSRERIATCLLLVNELFRSFPLLVALQLYLLPSVLDILLNLFCILPCRIYVISSAPELTVPVFIFQFRILFVNHQAALSFKIFHETGYRNFRRYLHHDPGILLPL